MYIYYESNYAHKLFNYSDLKFHIDYLLFYWWCKIDTTQ